jgi:phosphatidate phosphatase PAH1
MSCSPFDIQISKFVLAKLHYAKVSKTYNYLTFSMNLSSISCEKKFLEGKKSLGHKCKHKHLIHKLSTNCMDRSFLTINKLISSRNNLICYIYPSTKDLWQKNIDHCIVVYYLLFTILRPFGPITQKANHGGQIILSYWQHAINLAIATMFIVYMSSTS